MLDQRRNAAMLSTTAAAAALREQAVRRSVYERLLEANHAAHGAAGMRGTGPFAGAQAMHMNAASVAIDQLAARQAVGDTPHSALLRQRRDLLGDWQAANARIDELQLQPDIDRRALARLQAIRREVEARTSATDRTLAARFPDLPALLQPRAVGVRALRRALRTGEAFLMQVTTDRATHLWLVTPDVATPFYARSPASAADLSGWHSPCAPASRSPPKVFHRLSTRLPRTRSIGRCSDIGRTSRTSRRRGSTSTGRSPLPPAASSRAVRPLRRAGLVLTPPLAARPRDDGLLTASEISRLTLNGELVILSACDTAATDGSSGGEGLSGLAQAFFYAGARSLVVSGWPVKADVAEALTTGLVRRSSTA